MHSLYEIILKRFVAFSVVQVVAIGMTLMVAIFMFNRYQTEKNQAELEKVTETTFKEISDKTASNIYLRFEKAFLLARQLQTQAQEVIGNLDNYANPSLQIYQDEAFFRDDIEGLSSVYTTNRAELGKRERKALEQLSLLVPLMRQGVEKDSGLISAAWINIGSSYAARYPYINVSENVPPSLDVTQYRFYYEANPEYNPKKDVVFIDLHKEPWALGLGEIAVILAPIYIGERFIGVIGLNLTVSSIAESLLTLKLPNRSYMMLMDEGDALIASSDEARNMNEFGVNSFYHYHQNPPAGEFTPAKQLMLPTKRTDEGKISYEAKIPMTKLKVVLCANRDDIFENITEVYEEGQKVGYYLVGFIFLFYVIFFSVMLRLTKKLATYIAAPLREIVEFSKSLGTSSSLTLHNTGINEFQSLNENLLQVNGTLAEMLIKDSLTRLYNQRKLLFDLKKRETGVLIYFSIDHFKTINGTYGNDGGDAVLIHIAKNLERIGTDSYRVYRIGADSFAVYESAQNLFEESMLTYIRDNVEDRDFTFNDIELDYSLTFGVTSCAETPEKTVKQAELALETAKQMYRGKYLEYDESLKASKDFEANLTWGKKVKKAIDEDRIFPVFQPIYNLQSNRVEKFESLVRMCEGGEVISPGFFLEAAKNTGLLNTITRIMIRKVFALVNDYPEIEFSINLSFSDFWEDDMFDFIHREYVKQTVDPSRIVFEVLETEALVSENEQIEIFARLKEMGFQIAIDDFGSGYSNFGHILKIRTDYIKIDGQFIKNIHENSHSHTIAKTIVDFSKNIDTKTVAEFVSSQEALDEVRKLGVNYVQGYQISPPIEQEKISECLEKCANKGAEG